MEAKWFSVYQIWFAYKTILIDENFWSFTEMEEDENVGQKNGFFKTYHLKVLESLNKTDLEQLQACTNDEQRFIFCHSLPYIHQHQPKALQQLFKPKSSTLAAQKRIGGNKAFQAKNYLQAQQLYSLAILKAPFYDGTNS